MSLRTKEQSERTARKGPWAEKRVRPFERIFLGAAAVLLALLPAVRCQAGGAAEASAVERAAAPEAPAATPTPDLFATSVRPVLSTKCAPCHEPGGKLYEKLPFDQPSVVASHSAGVLRRLQGENKEVVEKWLATLSPGP
jgi:hypothetical protein